MELDLSKYPTDKLMGTYEFIFAQWVGGATTEGIDQDDVPTIYVMEQLTIELRDQLTGRPDCDPGSIQETERKVIKILETVLNLSEKQLREIWEQMLIQVEGSERKMRKDLLN